jgi:5-methylcytosine-specific restriction enzyme subunit McrC
VIRAGDLLLSVEPKIPREHLFYLFGKSGLFPRVYESLAASEAGSHLWELLARWFISSLEGVLRRDLVRDYAPQRDDLTAARGQIEPLQTASLYFAGRMELACSFEEFSNDTPLNRTLNAAAHAVAGSFELAGDLRRRAARLAARMDDVGQLQVGDSRAQVDRRTAHYGDALAFARSILTNTRRALTHGELPVWSFLIPTPRLVEDGVRNVVREQLAGQFSVKKGVIPLAHSPMTVEPDLVIGDNWAVADVKYKLSADTWKRPDLYELVSFAEAAGAASAAIIGFTGPGAAVPPLVGVGGVSASYLSWPSDSALAPPDAAASLGYAVQQWLSEAAAQAA